MEIITAVIGSLFIGWLVGLIFGGWLNSPSCWSLEDFERERRLRAENEATRLYIELENMRRDNLRLASYPLYSVRDSLVLEIQKLPRAESLKQAQEKYGEYWQVTDAIIGKVNELVSEANNPTIKRV